MLMRIGNRLRSISLPPRHSVMPGAGNTSVLSGTHHYGDGNPPVFLGNGLPEQELLQGSEVSDNRASPTASPRSGDKLSIGLSEVENSTRASKSIDHKSAPEELAQSEGYRTGA
jgi:hypothetical protein